MNKNTTILLSAIAVIAIGIWAYVSMSSPSNKVNEEEGFKTQSVDSYLPLVINDGTRWWNEWYYDIPCNDSGKLDITAFINMIKNPEKCQCVSKHEANYKHSSGMRIWLLWTDGIRYAGTKENYETLCPEWRFIAGNWDLYMIGQCANAVALWYWSSENPENIFFLNNFQTACSNGWLWDSCENNSQCESWYCEQTTVSKCVSWQYGEKIACAWFTSEEQCLGFTQPVGPNNSVVSVCEWEEIVVWGTCSDPNEDNDVDCTELKIFDCDGNWTFSFDDIEALRKNILWMTATPTLPICDLNGSNSHSTVDQVHLQQILLWSSNTDKLTVFDFNNDWIFNETDIILLQKIISGNEICPTWKVCDLNRDGVLDKNDKKLLNAIINNKFQVCNIGCGNSIVEWTEQCDDWNFTNWDWCNNMCEKEKLQEPFCGNGILDKWEQCDGVWQAQCGKWATCSTTWKAPCTCQYSEVIGPDKIPEGTSDGKAWTKDTTQPTSLPTTRSLTR